VSTVITTCGPNCQPANGGPCSDPIVTHVGATLATYEQNGYDDSDFYAIVVDDGKLRHVMYATTRGWTYHNGAIVDATPDTLADAEYILRGELFDHYLRRAATEAMQPTMGKTVRMANGVTGVVAWSGPDRYRRGGIRVGIRVGDARKLTFVAATDVDVIDPVTPTADELRAQAKRVAGLMVDERRFQFARA
jgi:hypothetical protein